MLSPELLDSLQGVPEAHLISVCKGFGLDKRTKKTAIAALSTLSDVQVEDALEHLERALAQDMARTARAADPGASASDKTKRGEADIMCSDSFEFRYNRPVQIEGGVRKRLPLPIARYANKIAIGKGYTFELQRIVKE